MRLRAAALGALFLAALAARPAAAEVRPGTFRSEALGREVSYVVDLPPSYDGSGDRRYPVVYALHGLFEGSGFWERRGLAPDPGPVCARAARCPSSWWWRWTGGTRSS